MRGRPTSSDWVTWPSQRRRASAGCRPRYNGVRGGRAWLGGYITLRLVMVCIALPKIRSALVGPHTSLGGGGRGGVPFRHDRVHDRGRALPEH